MNNLNIKYNLDLDEVNTVKVVKILVFKLLIMDFQIKYKYTNYKINISESIQLKILLNKYKI